MINDPSETRPRFFASFWQAGYEGADHINGHGQPLALSESSGHDRHVETDYAGLGEFGIRTIRESVGWRLCEKNGRYDFSKAIAREQAARHYGLQIVWTIWHYGIPDDLDYGSPELPVRFADFCAAFATALGNVVTDLPRIFVPINEPSFLVWALCETKLISSSGFPLFPQDADRIKRHFADASIRAIRAIRAVMPAARFAHIDPLIHVVAPFEADEAAQMRANDTVLAQYDALDLVLGHRDAGLGGHPSLIDAVGLNYYHSNQWELLTDRRLHWHLSDARRETLSALIERTIARTGKPVFIAETGHVGLGRARWMSQIARELRDAQDRGVRIEGVCLYPVVDRPDWQDPSRWHECGLWDVNTRIPTLPRSLNAAFARSFFEAQALLSGSQKSRNDNEHQESFMTLIVYSHLRWDFVFQRPQHLMTRLAAHTRVVFVEEPMGGEQDGVEVLTPYPNLEVLRLHTTRPAKGFDATHRESIGRMVRDHLEENGIADFVAWFYTPMALPLLALSAPRAIVYDCMDELSAFKNAPANMLAFETQLLKMANAVFTGGPSLYEAKRNANAQTHCFSSSVDVAHFATAKNIDMRTDAAETPTLGFYGVIDERLDLELVAGIAAARPNWRFCYVGPVVKIDPATLPQAPNIHYLPQQSYDALPWLLAEWDICLMPFARNESTAFISPTKTLEYLAAGKPVVSTSIRDVATLYGDCVHIADDVDSFVEACELALQSLSETRRTAIDQALARTSWDRTATAMATILRSVAAQGLTAAAQHYLAGLLGAPTREVATLIVGAGPTGLSAAYHLGEGSLLVEANDRVGGWCRSYTDNGFQFDYAGHIMFSNDPYVHSLYEMLLGDNIHWQDREAWVYSKNVYTRYPFQGALHGLPPDVLKDCLIGAIEARFGTLKPASEDAALERQASDEKTDCCGDGVGLGGTQSRVAKLTVARNEGVSAPANFEEFIHRVWGAGVAKHFAIPYNTKLWTVPLAEMETSWLGSRVPLPNLEQMIEGALSPVAKPMGPNARFGYPLRGGFQALMDGFLPHLRGELLLSRRVVRVRPSQHSVTFDDGSVVRYDHLINTMPLPTLVALCGEEAPRAVREAAEGLRHVSVRCVNLGIGRAAITDKHWIYYPEDTIFHRIFLQGNASPHCNPPDGFGLTCEISYSPTKPLPVDGDALIDRCIADCVRVGMIKEDDPILSASQVDMPYAYVVYDHARARNVACVRGWLSEQDIVLAGRYSEWEYYNSDHAFVAGKKAAESIQRARKNAMSLIA